MNRELWQPSKAEQIKAAETLLQGPIPYRTRLVVRELFEALERTTKQEKAA